MLRYLTTLLICFSFYIQHCQSQVALNKSALDSLFDVLEKNRKCMGAVSVMHGDKVVYQRHMGFRDTTQKGVIFPDDKSLYRIGSITKMFTAVMIIQLIEEGKLAYNTRLSKFYPQIPHADSITIEMMLHHHSGLPHFDHSSDLVKLMRAKDKNNVLKIVCQTKTVRADVMEGHYSNLNYILLGFIIETVSGTDLSTQISERIVKKAGMKNTYGQQEYISASRNEAHSFTMRNGMWREDYEDHYPFQDASGYVMSTPTDLTQFITALFGGSLISPASLAKMTTIKGDFGEGIFPTPFDDKNGFGHTGRIDGFVSCVSYFPDDQLAVSIIINGQIYPMNDILIEVLNILFGKPYELPKLKSVSLSDEQIKAFEGKFSCSELPMTLIVKKKEGGIQVQLKQKGAIFKQVMIMKSLEDARFIYDGQGIIADFSEQTGGTYSALLLRVSGAKLHFKRIQK